MQFKMQAPSSIPSCIYCLYNWLGILFCSFPPLKLAFWINYSKNPWKRAHSAISHRVINRAEGERGAEAALCRQSLYCISFLFTFTLCFSFPLFSLHLFLSTLTCPFFPFSPENKRRDKSPLLFQSGLNQSLWFIFVPCIIQGLIKIYEKHN